MKELSYRLLNVFAEQQFGGNPLCVVEGADGLSEQLMQAIALQFNLSETVFLQTSAQGDARIRIFTPATEMAFAGHPSLGAAAVVSALLNGCAALTLECRAGLVPLRLEEGIWWLSPPAKPESHRCETDAGKIAAALGIGVAELAAEPVWVNTGSDQLLVPLRSAHAVRQLRPDAALFARDWPRSSLGRRTACVFAVLPDTEQGSTQIQLRYFFERAGGGLAEDPATGSACANLGAWWGLQKRQLPLQAEVHQGEQMGRPSRLYLQASADAAVRVGGKVREIGCGRLQIDENL